MIPAVAQPAFCRLFGPPSTSWRHATRTVPTPFVHFHAYSAAVCRRTSDLSGQPACLQSARPAPRCISPFRSSTTATRHPSAAEARTRGRERRESLSLFQQNATTARRYARSSFSGLTRAREYHASSPDVNPAHAGFRAPTSAHEHVATPHSLRADDAAQAHGHRL
jgi:hypothetical protein